MLKMHEESMKALQDSATEEMNRLKVEIAILKYQKRVADEQNQRHSEAYKLLQQEKQSLADTLWQAEASIFSKFSPSWVYVVWVVCIIELMRSLSEFCSSSGFNPVTSFAKGMHGSCWQLHQHRHHARQV